MSAIIHIDSPLLTIEEFAKRSGMTKDAVRHKVNNGELPTVDTRLDPTKRGRIYINMVKLVEMADQAEFMHPAMNEA